MGASVRPDEGPRAPLFGDTNSPQARAALLQNLMHLPQNVMRSLHNQPVSLAPEPPEGDLSSAGVKMLQLAKLLHIVNAQKADSAIAAGAQR